MEEPTFDEFVLALRGVDGRGCGVRELALHILDLIENSIRAQATVIAVSVVADSARIGCGS